MSLIWCHREHLTFTHLRQSQAETDAHMHTVVDVLNQLAGTRYLMSLPLCCSLHLVNPPIDCWNGRNSSRSTIQAHMCTACDTVREVSWKHTVRWENSCVLLTCSYCRLKSSSSWAPHPLVCRLLGRVSCHARLVHVRLIMHPKCTRLWNSAKRSSAGSGASWWLGGIMQTSSLQEERLVSHRWRALQGQRHLLLRRLRGWKTHARPPVLAVGSSFSFHSRVFCTQQFGWTCNCSVHVG